MPCSVSISIFTPGGAISAIARNSPVLVEALRKAGLRPVQLWVPDTRQPDFARECQRQSRLAVKADLADAGLAQLMDQALANVEGWTA